MERTGQESGRFRRDEPRGDAGQVRDVEGVLPG